MIETVNLVIDKGYWWFSFSHGYIKQVKSLANFNCFFVSFLNL